MAKDRLGDLKKAQQKNNNGQSVSVNIETVNSGDGSHVNQIKQTLERAEVLIQWIESIEENVEDIRHYLIKLDDLTLNQKDLNDKITNLFQNNTSVSHKITSKLKELEEELKEINLDSAEGRIKSIQFSTLKTRYRKIFQQNSLELESYRNTQKNKLELQFRAKGVKVTDEELVSLLDNNVDIQVFTDNIIAETAEAKRVLQDLEERHQQLLKIERMLAEVRDLFLQMAILVDTQQDLVDRVEYQAQAAVNFVEKIPKILEKTNKRRIKYLKCKIYIGIALVVFVIILLVMLLKSDK